MANTTWNPSDKTASLALSGGNLIATGTAVAIASVRTVDRQVTGKFYFEFTFVTAVNGTTSIGVVNAAYPLSTSPTSPNGIVGSTGLGKGGVVSLDGSTNVIIDGAIATVSFGGLANGTVVCVALDLTSRRIWYRLGAAGNWNNVAGRDPVTGVGGVSIGLGIGVSAFPLAVVGGTSDQITANFGDSAFTGAVPAGFTSGFTAGASVPTNAIATQAALEQWGAANPQAQVTQIALEQWTSVATASGRTKVWNGSAWVIKPVNVWSGSAWVAKPVKIWNGSAWT